MGERAAIKDVFVQCQTGLQGHGKLAKVLGKIYEHADVETFWQDFCQFLKYAMIVFKREPAVERVIDFVAKFITSIGKKSEEDKEERDEDEEEDSVEDNKLLQKMFDFLLESHSAADRGVRFRCCQLINKLLVNLGDDAQIDDDLYDRLYESMLERLKDKCPVVRYHAVLAMARLQDPGDENCPVIKAYLFLLNCDPNPDVRRAVLQSIAPSTKTLASIVGRTRDVKDTVRKTAYFVISEKIHIKAVSIALRLQILNEGLNDRADAVKQACSGKLLQSWLRTLDGKVLELLRSLDVEDSTSICSKVLETLYKASSVQGILDGFDLLDSNLLIPEDKLTSESALYWQSVCKYLHGLGNEGEEYIEKVLPNCVTFCAFVQRYVDDLKTVDDPEIQLNKEFIIEQLLLIASYMDTADSASRKALEKLLHDMLMADCVSHRLVKSVITRICELKGTKESIMPYIAETVAEIREPITVVEKDIEAEQKRQINLKIAGIRVQLNQLREDLDEAVRTENFSRAAEIKSQVAELDAEKVQLLEANEPAREEIRTERTDPETLLKCMTIVSEVLQIAGLTSVSPTLQMMIESQIVPGIQNENAEVRNMAMQELGLCCYLSKDLLYTYMPLFMQASQIDVELVRLTALRILFDVLLIFGLEEVAAGDASPGSSDTPNSDETSETADAQNSDSLQTNGATHNTASKLVAIISSFLDGESSELRMCAAEGLAKLLLSGRVVSAKILSHLILLWYNPMSEDDTHLRDCLGTFFPMFALASRANQEVVEGAFLPTLRTLLNAPANSPLAEVNVSNVAELLVQLTNSKLVTTNMASAETNKDNPGHDNLLETVSNEILSDPTSPNVRLWVRILNQMEPSPDNEIALKDLRVLCHKMVNLVKDKQILRSLQRFQTTINQLASQFVSGDDDLADVDIQPVVQQVEEMEQEPATPKRKRVRGLYTQASNLTMELDVDSDLDLTADTTQDIDATCLMSRTSESTSLRTHLSSLTELSAEDIIRAPDETRKRPSLMNKKADETKKDKTDTADQVAAEDVTDQPAEVFHESSDTEEIEQRSRSPGKKTGGKKRSASASPEKSQKSAGKRARSEEFSKAPKQKEKSSEKRSNSASPAGSPRKRSRSHGGSISPSKSPKGRNQSKSPGKKSSSVSPPKRAASKSPSARSASQGKKSKESDKRSPSKSPAKKPTSKSPQRKPTSKSPEKKKSVSKSPQRKPASKSPEKKESVSKSPQRKPASKSPEKKKSVSKSPQRKPASKYPEKKKSASKSPQRMPASKVPEKKKSVSKSPEKKQPQQTKKLVNQPEKKGASGTVSKLPTSRLPERRPLRQQDKAVTKQPPSRLAESKRLPSTTSQRNASTKAAVTAPEKNTRKAAPLAASRATAGQKVSVAKPSVRSPRKASVMEKKTEASSRTVADLKSASNIDKSPRVALKRLSQRSVRGSPAQKSPRASAAESELVVETPESHRSMRSTLTSRSSVFATPDSMMSSRLTRGTPSSLASSAKRSSIRQSPSVFVAETPSPMSKKKGGETTPSLRQSARKQGKPESDKTPNAKKMGARGSKRKSDVISSVSSVESTDSSQVVTESDEEEDVQLRRKARPSRRSGPTTASTPASGSQKSTDSPATRGSSRQSQAAGDSSSLTRSGRSVSRDNTKGTKTAAARAGKGSTVTSTPGSKAKPSPRVTRASPMVAAGTVKPVRGTPRGGQATDSDADTSVFSPPSSVRSSRSTQLTSKSSQSTARSSQSSVSALAASKRSARGNSVVESKLPSLRAQKTAVPARSVRSRSDRK